MKIPKTVHRIWYQDEEPIPFKFDTWVRSWNEFCPDYTFKMWNKTTLREAVVRYEPDYLSLYDDFDWDIKRIDFARYVILKHEGGIYADLDVQLYKPIDSLLDEQMMLTFEAPGYLLSNAVMMAEPNHPLWDSVFRSSIMNRHLNVERATGPLMFTQTVSDFVERQRGMITVLPPEAFHPFMADDPDRWSLPVPEDSYGVHWFAASWYKEVEPELNVSAFNRYSPGVTNLRFPTKDCYYRSIERIE